MMKLQKILGTAVLVLILAVCVLLSFLRFDLTKAENEKLLTEAMATPEPTPVPTPEATASPTPEPTSTPEPTATPEPTPDPNSPAGKAAAKNLPAPPDIDIESWEYELVNHWNSIGEYAPELEAMENNQYLDTRIAQPMRDFIAAARGQGLSVYLSSTYRTYNDQAANFQRKLNQGYSADTAWTIVALPGTSEHQLGLAADITDVYYPLKDSSLENTALYKWMSAHCHEYGFIVRYPKNHSGTSTSDAPSTHTGCIYEPWHFRYVGVEVATYIMENDLCLEEFVSLYKEIQTAENSQ